MLRPKIVFPMRIPGEDPESVMASFQFYAISDEHLSKWLDANWNRVEKVVGKVIANDMPWQHKMQRLFEEYVGASVPAVSIDKLVHRPPDNVEIRVCYSERYMRYPNQGWLVFAPTAKSDAEATIIGERLFRNLIGERNVSLGSPHVHDMRLMVAYPNGYVWVEPPPKKEKVKTGPTITEIKEDVVKRLMPTFGRKTHIFGNQEEGYGISLTPTTKKHKYASISTKRVPIEELMAQVEPLLDYARKIGMEVIPYDSLS